MSALWRAAHSAPMRWLMLLLPMMLLCERKQHGAARRVGATSGGALARKEALAGNEATLRPTTLPRAFVSLGPDAWARGAKTAGLPSGGRSEAHQKPGSPLLASLLLDMIFICDCQRGT